jgi:hypothetical protein
MNKLDKKALELYNMPYDTLSIHQKNIVRKHEKRTEDQDCI